MAEDKKQPTAPEGQVAPDTPGSTPAPEHIEQAASPGIVDNPAPSGKVIDLSNARAGAEKQAAGLEKTDPPAPEMRAAPGPVQNTISGDEKAPWERPLADIEAEKPKKTQRRSSKTKAPTKAAPADKGNRATPEKATPPKPEKAAKAKKAKAAPVRDAALKTEPEAPPVPRDATRVEEEKTVYINISELHPFKEHPFGVRDDAEMQALVESVSKSGVNQPALVRPREDGGYEIIAGHRRQRASELAGYFNMPCIVRNMTDDEAILAMTDDNLRHREKLLPSEKAAALLQQYEAIKHQGARGDDEAAGKLSLENVGQRNGMSVKTVQRYIWLNALVPDLKETMDGGKLSFTPAVEISRIRPKLQKYIAVSIEGQQSSPSKGQAQRLREMDKESKLNPDVIDAILSEEKKKEVNDVIISSAELSEYFGKEATPREMKDRIMALLGEWKEKQPPELNKPDKKKEMEK